MAESKKGVPTKGLNSELLTIKELNGIIYDVCYGKVFVNPLIWGKR